MVGSVTCLVCRYFCALVAELFRKLCSPLLWKLLGYAQMTTLSAFFVFETGLIPDWLRTCHVPKGDNLQLLILPLSSQMTHYVWPFSCRPIDVGNGPFQG